MNVYEIVTSQILDELANGTVPWKKPWKGGTAGMPRNHQGLPYKGMNLMLLGNHSYEHNYWFGLSTARQYGGYVKSNEFMKSRKIVFYKAYDADEENEKRRWVLVYHRVWNLDQIDGMKLPDVIQEHMKMKAERLAGIKPIEECEKLVNEYTNKPLIKHTDNRACYSPELDYIGIPEACQFDSMEEYYSTLFHEFTHSTGHEKRLARKDFAGTFGDHNYSFEELVAEIGSSYLSAIAGTGEKVIKNSAAYINGWHSKLKSDPKMIVKASIASQKAVDYILGKTTTKEEPCQTTSQTV